MKVTIKGQVTIPRDIRRRFGMEAGSEVEFTARNGEVIVRPKQSRKHQMAAQIQRSRGSATAGLATDEIMRMTRGED
jgi:AbrB family looped-hinge helix DNA binding protein